MARTRPGRVDPEARHASGVLPRHNHSKLRDTALASLASLQLRLLDVLLRLELPLLRRRAARASLEHVRLGVSSRSATREPRDRLDRGHWRRFRLLLLLAVLELRDLLQGLLQHTRHRAAPFVRSHRSHPGQFALKRTSSLHDCLRSPLLRLHADGSVRKHLQQQINRCPIDSHTIVDFYSKLFYSSFQYTQSDVRICLDRILWYLGSLSLVSVHPNINLYTLYKNNYF